MTVILSKQAKKFIEKQDKNTRQRLRQAIEDLESDEPKGDILRMTNAHTYRVRVGDYRIIFEYRNGKINIEVIDYIYVLKINNRGEIYKKG